MAERTELIAPRAPPNKKVQPFWRAVVVRVQAEYLDEKGTIPARIYEGEKKVIVYKWEQGIMVDETLDKFGQQWCLVHMERYGIGFKGK